VAVVNGALAAEEGVGGTVARGRHGRLRQLKAKLHSEVTSAGRAEERAARRLSRASGAEEHGTGE
jgi:hypothetical protein